MPGERERPHDPDEDVVLHARLPWLERLEGRLGSASPRAEAWIRRWHRLRFRFHSLRESRRAGDARNLCRFERKVYSQQGEDGILEEIFRRIGVESRSFVEFGIQDGSECCARNLLENHGWNGVWLEGDPAHVERARHRFGSFPVRIVQAFLTRENINALLDEADVPRTPDLLVVDVDGNDYWLLAEILRHRAPRVIAVEYNGAFGPRSSWVMPYDPSHRWDGTCYFGASLSALSDLAARHGYRLVGCDSLGVNAFFVRASVLDPADWEPSADPRHYYVAPKYGGATFGHPRWRLRDSPMQRLEPSAAESVRIVPLGRPPSRVRPESRFEIRVQVDNDSPFALGEASENSVRLAYHWIPDTADGTPVWDGHRTLVRPRSRPATRSAYRMEVEAPPNAGTYTLVVTLVQEGNFWFDQVAPVSAARCGIVVRG